MPMIDAKILAKAVSLAKVDVANREGLRLTAYRNKPTEPWTYGFGFTRKMDGSPVLEGDTISKADAYVLLTRQVNGRLGDIINQIQPERHADLTAHMLAALVSLHHNIGPSLFRISEVLRDINTGEWARAAQAFEHFHKGNSLNDLLPRRLAEEKEFKTEDDA